MLRYSKWLKARTSRRRLLVAGGSGLVAAEVAACTRGSNGASRGSSNGAQAPGGAPLGTPVPGGTLSLYLNYNTSLDPQKTTASVHVVIAGVYSRIFKFKTALDPRVALDHEIENDLGLRAETPDGMTWTVKLRPDARFHNIPPVNGHPVEAEDVKATFVRAINPATNNPNLGSLDMIDTAQIQTPDSTTVVFKLRYPYAPFNRMLASPSYSLIVPREALAGNYDLSKVVIGSGPFTMEGAVPDVAYTYKKNPGYFDRSIPNVDGVRIAIIPDTSQQLAQFTAGNLDELILDSPFSLDAATKSNPKATVVRVGNGNTYAVYYQLGDPSSIFQDIRIRRAFNMAIDRDTLGKLIFDGESVSYVFLPAYMGKWSMPIKDLPASIRQYYTYNPAEAKKLLDAAGASGAQFKLAYPNRLATPAFVKQVETVGNMLSSAGVKINVVEVDYGKDWIGANGKGINGGFYPKDMLPFTGYSVFTEADEWIFGFLDSKTTQSHINVKDSALDAMIDKERATLDEAERVKAVLDIQAYVADKAYYVPTAGDGSMDILIQPRVHNYQPSTTPGKVTETYAKLWLSA